LVEFHLRKSAEKCDAEKVGQKYKKKVFFSKESEKRVNQAYDKTMAEE
jgi:hypothetical protein